MPRMNEDMRLGIEADNVVNPVTVTGLIEKLEVKE